MSKNNIFKNIKNLGEALGKTSVSDAENANAAPTDKTDGIQFILIKKYRDF